MADTILGALDVDNFTTNERPENWFEALRILNPNGETPFTAMLGMMPSAPVDDQIFHWFEQEFVTTSVYANAAATDSATGLTFDDGAGTGAATHLRNGMILLNQRTDEEVIVRGQATDKDGTVTVVRGYSGSSAAAVNDNDEWLILSVVAETGSGVPDSIYTQPTDDENYTQIFKGAYRATRSELQTRLRWAPGGMFNELKRQALQRFGIWVELQALFGRRQAPTAQGPGGGYEPRTGGVTSSNYMPAANIKDHTADNEMSRDEFHDYMRSMFQYGSGKRVSFCGGEFKKWFIDYVESQQVRMVESVSPKNSFMTKVTRWESDWGQVDFMVHPLMWRNATLTKNAMFLDFNSSHPKRRRTLFEVEHQTNTQDRGVDAVEGQFIGEFGFEWPFGKTDIYIKGATEYTG